MWSKAIHPQSAARAAVLSGDGKLVSPEARVVAWQQRTDAREEGNPKAEASTVKTLPSSAIYFMSGESAARAPCAVVSTPLSPDALSFHKSPN